MASSTDSKTDNNADSGADSTTRVALRCPICGRPSEPRVKPFCSVRCADRDLRRWLTGGYAIASGGADGDEDGDDAIAFRTPTTPGQPVEDDE